MSVLWRREPRVGDVVRLLSGGPLMTITFVWPHSIDGASIDRWTLGAMWFADGELIEGKFDSETVRLAPMPRQKGRS